MLRRSPLSHKEFRSFFHAWTADLLTLETPSMAKGAAPELMEKWKIHDAIEMYGVRNWGKGYFAINKAGHLQVHPTKRPDRSVDLQDLIEQLQARGIQLPILLRFTDI